MKRFFIIFSLVFLASCQPSRITRSWAAKDVVPKKYHKILVIGVLNDNDYELQVKIEDHLAADLKEMGYNANAANKIFPPGTFVKGDTSRSAALIIGNGFDGVLTVVLLDKTKERFYVPGKISDFSNLSNYSRIDIYFNSIADKIYSPGYYGEETKYIWENNFYDLSSRRLIYSARSRSFDMASKTTLAHAYGQLMAGNLVDKKILVKREDE